MCNRYGIQGRLHSMIEEMSQLKIPLRFEDTGLPNLQPRKDIRPTNDAPIMRPVEGGVELVERRWDLVPFFHKGPLKAKKYLCTNARSETVATQPAFREAFKRRRCLVPASHYFEWTGEKGAKTKWKFTVVGQEWFCFPGLWDRAETEDGVVESFTLLTCAPGEDCSPYHTRQPVILERSAWAAWLDPSQSCEEALRPLPAGSVKAELAG
jgi:putative SOS response-associated peptidase YedK